MSRVNQLPEVINIDDEGHIEDHEIIHEALRGYDVEIADKADADHTHDWSAIEEKPVTFPPESHAHTISEITNLQINLDSKSNTGHVHSAVDITTGKLDIQRIPVGTGSGNVAAGNDSRFKDSRTPKAHTHGISDVTNLEQRLDIKADLVQGKVPTSQIPAMALTKPFSVTSRGGMTALDAQEGDIAIISAGADKGSYILGDGPSTSFDSWLLLAVESSAPVQSVNGQTGTIVLSPSDIGAAPDSHSHTIAQITNLQTTLNQKANADHTHSIANITGLEVALNGKAPAAHNHTTAQITGLDAALSGKSDAGHSHTIAEVTSLQAELNGKAASSHTHAWSAITSKPTTFTPSAHAHPISEITGLQTALNNKSETTHSHAWGDITGKPSTFPPTAHTHTPESIGAEPASWTGTQAQYDAIGTKSPNITYYVVEA